MKRSCFTLIELLVAIAMVILLLAILINVLNSVRQRARAVACSSNIRALTLGLIMYKNENEAFPYGFRESSTPPPGDYVGHAIQDGMGWWWINFLDEYVKKSKEKTSVFNCPSGQIKNPQLSNIILYGNYGVNLSICKNSDDFPVKIEFIGAPLGDEEIPHPSQSLLIIDSGYSIISWWYATNDPPVTLVPMLGADSAYVPGLKINIDRNLMPGQEQDAIDGRHPNKKVNSGFADGHVARKKADDLLVEKEGDTYTNRSPLWVPE